MILATNKSIRDGTELLAGDEALATVRRAVRPLDGPLTLLTLERLLHRSHVLNIKGRSYRLRDLEDALKA